MGRMPLWGGCLLTNRTMTSAGGRDGLHTFRIALPAAVVGEVALAVPVVDLLGHRGGVGHTFADVLDQHHRGIGTAVT